VRSCTVEKRHWSRSSSPLNSPMTVWSCPRRWRSASRPPRRGWKALEPPAPVGRPVRLEPHVVDQAHRPHPHRHREEGGPVERRDPGRHRRVGQGHVVGAASPASASSAATTPSRAAPERSPAAAASAAAMSPREMERAAARSPAARNTLRLESARPSCSRTVGQPTTSTGKDSPPPGGSPVPAAGRPCARRRPGPGSARRTAWPPPRPPRPGARGGGAPPARR